MSDSFFFFDQKNPRRPCSHRTKKYIDETPYLSRPDSALHRLRRKSALPHLHEVKSDKKQKNKSRKKPANLLGRLLPVPSTSNEGSPLSPRIVGRSDASQAAKHFDFDQQWNEIEQSFRNSDLKSPAKESEESVFLAAPEQPTYHSLKSALSASRVQILVEAEKEVDREEGYREQYNFDEAKFAATGILQQLSKVLYLTEVETSDDLPDNLQVSLRAKYSSLIKETRVSRRKWQTAGYREMSSIRKQYPKRKNAAGGGLPAFTVDEEETSLLVGRKGSMEDQSRLAAVSGGGRESVIDLGATPSEVDVVKAKHTGETDGSPAILAYNRESRMAAGRSALGNPRTRLERYKVYGQMDKDDKIEAYKKVSVAPHERHEEILKDFRDVLGPSTRGPLQTINFSLCSKLAVEKGWLLEPGDTIDPERKTMIEWLKERSKKLRKERDLERKEAEGKGHTLPLEVRYYSHHPKVDSARLRFEKRMQKARSQRLGISPEQSAPETEKCLLCQLPDGTRITYYPSGQTAICASSSGGTGHVPGSVYTLVYDSDEEGVMLGSFLPSGQGYAYYSTGSLRLAMDREGGILHNEDGDVTRRWKWPKDNMKLQPSVSLQLNECIQLRCLSKANITLFFTCNKEIVKYQVPAVPSAKEVAPIGMETLKTNLPFTSHAAREIYLEAVQLTQLTQSPKRSKGKKSSVSTVAPPFIVKLDEGTPSQLTAVLEEFDLALHLPVDTNEFDLRDIRIPEKELETMQSKVRFVVDEWMSHYRTTLGIKVRSSPRSSPASELLPPSSAPPRPFSGDGGISRPMTRVMATPDRFVASSAPRDISPVIRKAKSSIPELPPAVHTRLRCDSVIKFEPRRIPLIFDKIYDRFVFQEMPEHQMAVVYVCDSSKGPDDSGIGDMLERIYFSKNKNRIKPSATDPFRLVRYDIACAAGDREHASMLCRRHNAAPGMIFIYQAGKLLFADKIFNGYSSMKKDFMKQVKKSSEDFRNGRFLPANFRFGHSKARSRSPEKAWVNPGSIDRLSEPSQRFKSLSSPSRDYPERANSALNFITSSLSSERHLINMHTALGPRQEVSQSHPSNRL